MAQWYTFTTTGGADPSDPNNYSNPSPLKPSCVGNFKICAILADDNGWGQPAGLDCNFLTEMVIAMQTRTDSTRVALRF